MNKLKINNKCAGIYIEFSRIENVYVQMVAYGLRAKSSCFLVPWICHGVQYLHERYIYIYIYAYRIRTVSISVWFRVCCKFVVSTDSKLKSILIKGQKETHEFCDLTTSMVGFFFFFWPEQIPEFGWRKQGTPSTGWITKVMESHLDSPVMFLALMISFTTFPSTTAMFVVR